MILGHIIPFWKDEYKYLPYERKPFNNFEDIKLWREIGFSQEHFTGELYPLIDSNIPKWTEPFFTVFEGKNIGVNLYKMNTCNILPTHTDTYKRYKEIHNLNQDTDVSRAIIFLEDKKEGHILEIDNQPINWIAGDFVIWKNDTRHLAANLGIEPRYTAQVTYVS